MSGEPTSTTRARSTSRTRNSRPTTPLRPSSRSSFRESAARAAAAGGGRHLGEHAFPLEVFEPAFAELSDAMADLEANMMHFQLMHESLSRFSESFASFLYGLNMNAFCVDFPEGPIPESFKRAKEREDHEHLLQETTQPTGRTADLDGETTFLTTEASFVENPTTSTKATPTPKKPRAGGIPQSRVPAPSTSTRGGASSRASRGGRGTAGGTQRGRASGLARGRARGVRQ